VTFGYEDDFTSCCDFCGKSGGLTFSYDDDPDYIWDVCEDCPTITEEYEIV